MTYWKAEGEATQTRLAPIAALDGLGRAGPGFSTTRCVCGKRSALSVFRNVSSRMGNGVDTALTIPERRAALPLSVLWTIAMRACAVAAAMHP